MKIVEVGEKKISLPEDLLYSKYHTWVKEEDDLLIVGITDYAVQELGDIEVVDLIDALDLEIAPGEEPVEEIRIESNKAIGDIFAPAKGVITEINEELESDPTRLNEDCYEAWLFKMEPSEWESDKENLLNVDKYADILE